MCIMLGSPNYNKSNSKVLSIKDIRLFFAPIDYGHVIQSPNNTDDTKALARTWSVVRKQTTHYFINKNLVVKIKKLSLRRRKNW